MLISAFLFLIASNSWSVTLIIVRFIHGIVGSIFALEAYPRNNINKVFSTNIVLKQFNFRFLRNSLFWGLCALIVLYGGVLFGTVLLDEQGFHSIVGMGWGDTAFHLNMIGRLKYADPFWLENVVISGQRLTYPFMVNLLSALYERLGFSKIVAWYIPISLCSISFFFLLCSLLKRLMFNNKSIIAVILIVFFGGGLGFYGFFEILQRGGMKMVLVG